MPPSPVIDPWSNELERLARVLNQVGPDEVCCEGLTPRQCGILRTLIDRQGARISDLAADAGLSPSAMTRVLEKLEGQNLVQRIRGADDDRRAASVAITSRGREVRKRIEQLMRERTQQIIDAIPAGFRPQLLAGIRMLNQALEHSGCCEFSGEWPDVAISCKLPKSTQPSTRRKRHATE
ncbi:MAG TPA: MarR family transcriptional regulator [Terriglobales bacterium]|nr:MarR family transcriptional regulator [Terriglobales bacterium]